MKLSPLEVRKQEFSRTMRGYDIDEVRAFLSTIAGQMDELLEDQVRAESQLSDQKDKMGHLEDVQEALQATLNMARQNAEETRQTALKKAEMIVHEAHLKGEEILKKAERELEKLRTDIVDIETRRDQTIAKIKAVLQAELEMLSTLRPEAADRQKDSGVEVAALEFIDPKAREYKERLLAQAAAASKGGRSSGGSQNPDAGGSVVANGAAQPPHAAGAPEADNEKQDVAEVVAALKAGVDGDLEPEPGPEGKGEELEEMQKIRRILDDLE